MAMLKLRDGDGREEAHVRQEGLGVGGEENHHVSMLSQSTWRLHAFHSSHALSYSEKTGENPSTRGTLAATLGETFECVLALRSFLIVKTVPNLTVLNRSHWFLCAQMVLPAFPIFCRPLVCA